MFYFKQYLSKSIYISQNQQTIETRITQKTLYTKLLKLVVHRLYTKTTVHNTNKTQQLVQILMSDFGCQHNFR